MRPKDILWKTLNSKQKRISLVTRAMSDMSEVKAQRPKLVINCRSSNVNFSTSTNKNFV